MASTSEKGIATFVRNLSLSLDDYVVKAARVQFGTRELYSYGSHFPLAHFVSAKQGRSALWVVNGDTWRGGGWSLTSRHQSETRAAIAQAIEEAAKLGKRMQSVIVPFSALNGAQIDLDSIRPVHIRDDRTETFTNTATMARDYAERIANYPPRDYAERLARDVDPRGGAILHDVTIAGALKLKVTRVSDSSGETETISRTAKLTRALTFRGMDYSVPVLGNCGACEGSGMVGNHACTNPRCESGKTITGHGVWCDYDPPKCKVWLDGSDSPTITDDGTGELVTLTWSSDRHWLGDSLFFATIRGGKRYRFLSSFDYNERAPLYFLAALPRTSRAKTVDMAVQDLAPPAVHAAYARGLAVKRQGDIFLIPTPLTNADIAERAIDRARLSMHTHGGKLRKGETGYHDPLPGAAIKACAAMVRSLARAELRQYMADDKRPETPRGFKSDKRRELAAYCEQIIRHAKRVAAGENVCKCDTNYSNGDGGACVTCHLPRYYYGYTVENAKRGIDRAQIDYQTAKLKPRKRASGYANEMPESRKHGLCYSRALNAWRDANIAADAKWSPRVPFDRIRQVLAVHGTGHTATEVALCAGGVTYCRGRMRHVPAIAGERREADHAPLALDGALWYLAIRNTVPRQ